MHVVAACDPAVVGRLAHDHGSSIALGLETVKLRAAGKSVGVVARLSLQRGRRVESPLVVSTRLQSSHIASRSVRQRKAAQREFAGASRGIHGNHVGLGIDTHVDVTDRLGALHPDARRAGLGLLALGGLGVEVVGAVLGRLEGPGSGAGALEIAETTLSTRDADAGDLDITAAAGLDGDLVGRLVEGRRQVAGRTGHRLRAVIGQVHAALGNHEGVLVTIGDDLDLPGVERLLGRPSGIANHLRLTVLPIGHPLERLSRLDLPRGHRAIAFFALPESRQRGHRHCHPSHPSRERHANRPHSGRIDPSSLPDPWVDEARTSRPVAPGHRYLCTHHPEPRPVLGSSVCATSMARTMHSTPFSITLLDIAILPFLPSVTLSIYHLTTPRIRPPFNRIKRGCAGGDRSRNAFRNPRGTFDDSVPLNG